MKYQFDTCSYGELTRCVRARIKWIRECRRFIADPTSKGYHFVRMQMVFKISSLGVEIKKLLKMRRILKKSVTRQWNTDYFVKTGEWQDESTY